MLSANVLENRDVHIFRLKESQGPYIGFHPVARAVPDTRVIILLAFLFPISLIVTKALEIFVSDAQ